MVGRAHLTARIQDKGRTRPEALGVPGPPHHTLPGKPRSPTCALNAGPESSFKI